MTISLRELIADPVRALAADSAGPVIVIEDDRPVHVLLSYDGYKALVQGDTECHVASAGTQIPADSERSLIEALAMPGLETLPDDFEFPKANFRFQIPDLSD